MNLKTPLTYLLLGVIGLKLFLHDYEIQSLQEQHREDIQKLTDRHIEMQRTIISEEIRWQHQLDFDITTIAKFNDCIELQNKKK